MTDRALTALPRDDPAAKVSFVLLTLTEATHQFQGFEVMNG